MKNSIYLFLLFNTTILLAQSSENFFVTMDDEKVYVFENINNETYHKINHIFDTDYALTGQFFWYHDKNGELIKEKQSNIKDAYLNGRHYSNLSGVNAFGSKRLHEIKVQNDKYMLTQFYTHGSYLVYVIDKSSGDFIVKKELVSKKSKRDKKLFEKKIKPYFKNCKEFIELTNQSINTEYSTEPKYPVDNMFRFVSNIDCNN